MQQMMIIDYREALIPVEFIVRLNVVILHKELLKRILTYTSIDPRFNEGEIWIAALSKQQ
jgi:hypothetical protein